MERGQINFYIKIKC